MNRIVTFLASFLFAVQTLSAQDIPTVVADTAGLASSLAANPFGLLEGKVSGLSVLSEDGNLLLGPDIYIRGISSVRSGSMPVIIVDGVVLNQNVAIHCDPFWQYQNKETFRPVNPLSFLSAQDVESVQVLKNASSTAKYGVLGANGVILIQTKKGLSNGKNLEISSNFGIEKNNIDNNTNISYRGKSGNTKFNLSGTYNRQSGPVINSANNYFGMRGNVESRLGKWLDFGANLIFSRGNTSNKNVDYLDCFDDDVVEYRGLFSTWLDLHFTKNLTLGLKAGVDYQDQVRSVWYGKATPFGALYNGAAAKQSSNLFGYNASAKLTYNTYFAQKHHFQAYLSGELYGTFDEFAVLNGHNVLTEEIRANSINYLNSHFSPHAFRQNKQNIDAEVDVNYDYNRIVGLDASFRADFCRRYYGAKPLFLPAAEAWLDVHNMLFPQSRSVSALRIFGGYGVSCHETSTPYDMLGSLTIPAVMPVQPGAEAFFDAVTRIVADEWHAGASMSFADNRIFLQAQYYDKASNDAYSLYKFGRAVDFKGSTMWLYADGEVVDKYNSRIHNKGVEVDIKCIPLRLKKTTLSLYSTFSYNLNIISECESEMLKSAASKLTGCEVICTVANPVNSLYGFRTDQNGNFVDVTGEGDITSADRVVLGASIPTYNYALGAELTSGRFFAEMVISGASGHKYVDYVSLCKDGATSLTDKYVMNGTFLRLGRLGVKYNIPIRPRGKRILSGADVKAGARDIILFGPYPTRWSCYLGFDLKF